MSSIPEAEVDRIFGRALELEGNERSAYLDEACAGRRDIREAVDELLAFSITGDDLLDGSTDHRNHWLGDAEDVLKTDLIGRRVGSWQVIREIGRGGMGLVYLVERASTELKQQAALKLLQLGAGNERLARFSQERQILANLDHPGIARLLDGGVSDEGLPYLAMELVDGSPIDDFCEERNLSLPNRLGLFLSVCSAVDAAHRDLIIHRDLKPSNILVTQSGQVKLLDFGIAKLLDQSSAPTLTADNVRVMTPAYASPEQFLGETVGIASDVYQLGLLLFTLLTGRLPYDLSHESSAGAEELICRAPAPRASSTLRDQTHNLPEVDVELWRRSLRGDLDTIVAKALNKAPVDRYRSADALAADVRRHLDGLPIEARPPSLPYILRKWIGRYRAPVAVGTGILTLATAQTIGYTARLKVERDRSELARQEAEKARDEYQELSRFLVELFTLNDPDRPANEPVDAFALMDRATQSLSPKLDPLSRARFLHTTGEIYTKLARFDRAQALVEEALDLRQAELPPDHPDLLDSQAQLGVIYSRTNRFEESEALLEPVVKARRNSQDPEELAMALNNLGNLRFRQGNLQEAESFYLEALELRQSVLSPGHLHLSDSFNNVGTVTQALGRNTEAIPYLSRAAELFAETTGPRSPQRAIALNNLSIARFHLGRYRESGEDLEQALEIWTEVYGEEHPRTLRAKQNKGILFRRLERFDEAESVLRQVLELQQAAEAPEPLEIARTLSLLGSVSLDRDDLETARPLLDESFEIRQEMLGPDHRLTLSVRGVLGRLLYAEGRFQQAEVDLRDLVEKKKKAVGHKHPSTAVAMFDLARALIALDRLQAARSLLQETLEIRIELLGPDHPDTRKTEELISELDS